MKFSNVLAFVGLACASPFIQPQVRDQTIAGAISDAINALITAGEADLNIIVHEIETVGNTTEVVIKEELTALVHAFEEAATVIANVTANTAGIIAGDVKEVIEAEIKILEDAVKAGADFIHKVDATILAILKKLDAQALAFFKAELDALEAAIKPFADPLAKFVKEVIYDVAKIGGIELKILADAAHAFGDIIAEFLKSLGLGKH